MYETRKKHVEWNDQDPKIKKKYGYVFVIVVKSTIIKLKYVESQRLGRE